MTSASRTLLAVLGVASLGSATLAQAPASSGVATSADTQKISRRMQVQAHCARRPN